MRGHGAPPLLAKLAALELPEALRELQAREGGVPGDIVHLCAGDMIPADLRLMAAKDLFVNEASLTGESLPIEKHAAPAASAAGIAGLTNICFMRTTVVSGTATEVIALTGPRAWFGTLAETLAGALGFVALPPLYWPVLALMVLAYLGLTHIIKVWFHRRFGLD